MKKIGLSLLTLIALSNVSFAGGNFEKPVEPAIVIPQIEEVAEASVSGFYAGLGASVESTRESSLDMFSEEEGQDRTGNVTLLAGYDFNKYLAIEGRYIFSVIDQDIVERYSWGVFVRPQYPITEDFKVYGLLGYGGVDISGINNANQTIEADGTGFQWGLGLSYEVYENISIFIDYINLTKDLSTTRFETANANVDSDAFTIGVVYHF